MLPQRRFFVVLDGPDSELLASQARQERRDVRDQAAIVIAQALRDRGADRPRPASVALGSDDDPA